MCLDLDTSHFNLQMVTSGLGELDGQPLSIFLKFGKLKR